MNKNELQAYTKKTREELQEYLLLFKRRGRIIKPKKGKGSNYNRNKFKRGDNDEKKENCCISYTCA